MKNLIISLVFCFTALFGFSQDPFTITTQDEGTAFSITCPCYKLLVNDAKVENVLDDTEKWLEDKTKASTVEKETYFELDKVTFEGVSFDSIFVTYQVVPEENAASVYFNFSTASGSIKPLDQINHLSLKGALENLGNVHYLQVLEIKEDKESDILSDLEKELKKGEKDVQSIEKDIVEGNIEIDEIKQKVEVINGNESLITSRIGEQNTKIASLTGDIKKEAEKALKEIEKERDDLFKEKEKLHKDIVDAEGEIREGEFEKDELKSKIENYRTKIIEQRTVVDGLNKLISVTKEKL